MTKPKLPAVRDAKGHFVKGHSGNPTGKSARLITLPDGRKVTQTQLFQSDIAQVHRVLVDIVLSPTSKDRDKIVAGKILMDRAFGTPKQQIEVNNTGAEGTVRNLDLKGAETAALRELVNRLHNAQVVDAEYVEDDDAE